jgi:hypothetical protein|tara:strand:- start:123 stop:560 length:438 start_codon:yes stop_codon:yes gene_type:complete
VITVTTLKSLLELKESDNYQRDFNALREQVLPLMNQLAKENAELRKASEEKPLSETEWPKDLTPHPANPQVPVRETGRNGKKWKHYCEQIEKAMFLDDLREVILEMFNQGFLDTDVLDAVFCTVKKGRRISVHNYNGVFTIDNKA